MACSCRSSCHCTHQTILPSDGRVANTPHADAANADLCPVASACGSRHYCNAAKTCICVRSAEGINRCGKILATCHVQLCKTSADCANLGTGYFCDTPNSGCCTNPPATESR